MKRIIIALAAVTTLVACGGDGPTNQEQCDRYTELARRSRIQLGQPDTEYEMLKASYCGDARRDRLEAEVDG